MGRERGRRRAAPAWAHTPPTFPRTRGARFAPALGNSAPPPCQGGAAGKGDSLTPHTPCGGPIKPLPAEETGCPLPHLSRPRGSALKLPGPLSPEKQTIPLHVHV